MDSALSSSGIGGESGGVSCGYCFLRLPGMRCSITPASSKIKGVRNEIGRVRSSVGFVLWLCAWSCERTLAKRVCGSGKVNI